MHLPTSLSAVAYFHPLVFEEISVSRARDMGGAVSVAAGKTVLRVAAKHYVAFRTICIVFSWSRNHFKTFKMKKIFT